MSDRAHIGLDNPAFHGRLRQPGRQAQLFRSTTTGSSRPSKRYRNNDILATATYMNRSVVSARQKVLDASIRRAQQTAPSQSSAPPLQVVEPQPFAQPAQTKQQRSHVLKRQLVNLSPASSFSQARRLRLSHYSGLQIGLLSMAIFVFMFGVVVTLQTLQTNHSAAAQVSALSKQVDKQTATGNNQNSAVPSTTKPSVQAVSQYVVAPDLARYLKIPKLGVNARVMQVGVTKTGALGTPSNVYDTAWYTGSAKPGQPGATLIDGHVSSWTTRGVFYGIKTLIDGDMIQIVRGDGAILNYQVVKTQVYGASSVDMQAAVTPITPGKSGLNLITCTGQVEKGTSEFNERVIVFAQQV
jgi:sortase (surface protein transpeptidase)